MVINRQNEDSFYLEYKPKFKVFYELMAQRMSNVLLVSSIYDSFMLEEDGRLSDQIYEEFQNLNLRTLPRITRVSNAAEALKLIKEKEFDLVITMRRLGDIDAFSFGKSVKEIKNIPVILLLNSVVEINYLPQRNEREGIDRVFVWNGDSKLFVAIIKHLEDKLNADVDISKANVKVFIFIDDSIRFYSLILPELYGELMRQTHRLITEGTNDFQDLLKMRIRPKILLAETFEEAMDYFRKYKENVMGIISDVEFPKDGELNKEAGFIFSECVKKETHNIPVMLQSSREENAERAQKDGCFFIHKRSHGFIRELRNWLLECVGFGDFIFKLPNGEIVGRADDVINFYKELSKVPLKSLIYHGESDHFSNWLSARGEFDVAEILKPRKVSEFTGEDLRTYLLEILEKVVIEKTKGLINDFSRENYHPEILFLRLRPGSLGGKGRGLAFLMFLLNSFLLEDEFEKVSIEIPKTIVIGTDEFDKFMDKNNLYQIAFSDEPDEIIKQNFVHAKLSTSLKNDLKFLLKDLAGPLAVRSSSILEDSAYQPFAGIFATYMIPNNAQTIKENLEQLCTAIKLVYASPFLKHAKSYAETIEQTVEESKMAVVIQKVIGKEHNNHFYPDFSGTAASNNYYPFTSYMKSDDRIAHLALGLGKIIVEGGTTMRFCPKYPKINFYSTPDLLLEFSQKEFFAIDLTKNEFKFENDDPFGIKLDITDAINDATINEIADTYDFNSSSLRSGYYGDGSPVITFSRQLKLEKVPLAKVVNRILALGERTMGCPVEIEFAGNFKQNENQKNIFYILQIRPFLQQELITKIEIAPLDVSDIVIYSTQVSGNLINNNLSDIVFVKPENFDKLKTIEILDQIDEINSKLVKSNTPYILIGFGRWGTSDRFLGLPAKWNNICGAKVIIESELENFKIDFSQGSHFFHNLITANIGYMHIKYGSDEHKIDWDWLKKQKVIYKTEYVTHIRTMQPVIVKIDAQKKEGLIVKQHNQNKLK